MLKQKKYKIKEPISTNIFEELNHLLSGTLRVNQKHIMDERHTEAGVWIDQNKEIDIKCGTI